MFSKSKIFLMLF